MRKTFCTIAAVAFAILALAGCSTKEVGFDTLETARNQARDNAVWNAKKFRATDPRFEGLEIVSRGDSTQDPVCPQGDGWASIDFIRKSDFWTVKAKCSTVSAAIGCMTDDDFKKKSYANEDGQCASLNKVPFPFRKISE